MDVDQRIDQVAIPGENVASSKIWMRGHGTYLDQDSDSVLAGVAGRVERVNKLVSVRPLRGRYRPEVGDLVVGRVVEVQARRWKVDIGARLDAILMLSSINLPGGVQRRKLESDELQMRNYFAEGDLVVCEIQTFFQDGSVSLHTRSTKYGKLRNGRLVRVPTTLMPRLKSHFISLPNSIELIAGLNGFLWVGIGAVEAVDEDQDSHDLYANRTDDITVEQREAINRIAHLIAILASHGMTINESRILGAWEASVDSTESDTVSISDLAFSAKTKMDIISKVLLTVATS